MKTETKAAASQRRPKFASKPSDVGRSSLLPQVSEGALLCQHQDFKFLASGTVRQYISIAGSQPVCGVLLRQP